MGSNTQAQQSTDCRSKTKTNIIRRAYNSDGARILARFHRIAAGRQISRIATARTHQSIAPVTHRSIYRHAKLSRPIAAYIGSVPTFAFAAFLYNTVGTKYEIACCFCCRWYDIDARNSCCLH